MWLYLPGLNCVPESECLAKASELHSDFLDTTIEPWLTSSGKPMPPRSLPHSWKANVWMWRLSGLTCSRSMGQHGAAKWIASLPDSHARIYQSQGDGQASTENGPACSSVSATLPTLAKRDSSFWRTSQQSLLPPPPLWTKPKASSKNAPPPASWENWPTEGGMRSGSLFARPKWAPATSAIDGSASLGEWLTPNVPNGGRSVSSEVVSSKGMTESGKRTVGLESQSKHWPTPDTSGGDRCNTSPGPAGSRPNISLAAKQWATPDCNTSSYSHASGPTLSAYVTHSESSPQGRIAATGPESSNDSPGLLRRLNPAFVAWLMGAPWWWTHPEVTSCVRSEMESYRYALQRRLFSFFDAQESGSNRRVA